MRALAILGLAVPRRAVEPFHLRGVELEMGEEPRPADAILVFGGDGTLHRHLPALAELRAPVLAVPSGSGNDFAAALGLRRRWHALAAWRAFCAGRQNVRTIDLGRITPLGGGEPRLYCNVAGAGLDAEANRRANRYPERVRKYGGYALAALAAIFSYQPQRMRLQAEGESSGRILDEDALFVAIANSPRYGGGMRIAPHAQLDDGLLDACFVRRASPLRILSVFHTIFRGGHATRPEVAMLRARGFTLHSASPLPLYADGEYACHTPLRIDVVPAALRVIVPPA